QIARAGWSASISFSTSMDLISSCCRLIGFNRGLAGADGLLSNFSTGGNASPNKDPCRASSWVLTISMRGFYTLTPSTLVQLVNSFTRSQPEEGRTRHQEEAAKPPLNGADGGGWGKNRSTTPPHPHP